MTASANATPAAPNLAYLWGEDVLGLEEGAAAFAAQLAPPGERLGLWRVDAGSEAEDGPDGTAARRRARLLDDIESHLAMAPLLGPGTLVVVRQPGVLVADAASRDRLSRLLAAVPEGNGLCFTDLVGADGRLPPERIALRDAVTTAGGLVREFPVPTRERMEAWIATRASRHGIRLGPGAARELALRIGAHVRETDVDRRRQTQLADAELAKLALYRPGGRVDVADVTALVPETIPGSAWAFLDAVGARDGRQAVALLERLRADGVVLPVLVTQLHRRLRELITVRDHLDSGATPTDLVRLLRLAPFRARKLAEQAARWSVDELGRALEGMLDVDLRSKGIALDGRTLQVSDALDDLAMGAWLAEHAVMPAAVARRSGR